MIIRPAKKSDLKECEEIFRIPELATPSSMNFLSAEFLENYLDDNYFLVAEDGDKLVGAIYGEFLKGNGIIIWDFAVREEERGKGIGTSLLETIEKNAKKNGCKWVIIYALADNEKLLKLYIEFGYSRGTSTIEYAKDL